MREDDPGAALFASENAPATWPNICDSKTPRAMPATFTAPKGAARPERRRRRARQQFLARAGLALDEHVARVAPGQA